MKESTRKQLDRGVGKMGCSPSSSVLSSCSGFWENQAGPGLAAWRDRRDSWAQVLWLRSWLLPGCGVSHISRAWPPCLSTKGQHHPPVPLSLAAARPGKLGWRALVSPQQGIGGGRGCAASRTHLVCSFGCDTPCSISVVARKGAGWKRGGGLKSGCQASSPRPPPCGLALRDRLGLCCLWSSMGQSRLRLAANAELILVTQLLFLS